MTERDQQWLHDNALNVLDSVVDAIITIDETVRNPRKPQTLVGILTHSSMSDRLSWRSMT